LSGGMDSSLVAAMAVRHARKPVLTFTVSFPGHGRFDEAPYARRVAGYLGTKHTELVTDASFLESLPDFLRELDEPIGTHSTLPMYHLSRLVRDYVKVVLGGDGGDELFGGYPHYSLLARKLALERFLPAPVLRGTSTLVQAVMPKSFRGRTHIAGMGTGLEGAIAHSNMFFDRRSRQRLLTSTAWKQASTLSPENQRAAMVGSASTSLAYATKTDFLTTLCDSYLVKVDRASMLASLEVRAPLLSRAVVEFAFRDVPDHLKVHGNNRKIIVAALVRKVFGDVVDTQRKQGFTMPLSTWLRQKSTGVMEAAVTSLSEDTFRRKSCQEIIALSKVSPAHANRLFVLAALGLWQDSNRIVAG